MPLMMNTNDFQMQQRETLQLQLLIKHLLSENNVFPGPPLPPIFMPAAG